jgi:hypothetical protein
MGVGALSLGPMRGDGRFRFRFTVPPMSTILCFGPSDVRRMTRAALSHMSCRIGDGSTILELGEDMALSLISARNSCGETWVSFSSIIISPREISIPSHLALHLHTSPFRITLPKVLTDLSSIEIRHRQPLHKLHSPSQLLEGLP